MYLAKFHGAQLRKTRRLLHFSIISLFQAKMKLLTFMQLAETKSEITFGEIQQHMQLGENEVEEFLIDRKFKKCFISLHTILSTAFTPIEAIKRLTASCLIRLIPL